MTLYAHKSQHGSFEKYTYGWLHVIYFEDGDIRTYRLDPRDWPPEELDEFNRKVWEESQV